MLLPNPVAGELKPVEAGVVGVVDQGEVGAGASGAGEGEVVAPAPKAGLKGAVEPARFEGAGPSGGAPTPGRGLLKSLAAKLLPASGAAAGRPGTFGSCLVFEKTTKVSTRPASVERSV